MEPKKKENQETEMTEDEGLKSTSKDWDRFNEATKAILRADPKEVDRRVEREKESDEEDEVGHA